MIQETSGVLTRVGSERIARESGGDEVKRREKDADVNRQDSFADSVSFSAEAVALAKNVPAASSAAETENKPAQREARAGGGGVDLRI